MGTWTLTTTTIDGVQVAERRDRHGYTDWQVACLRDGCAYVTWRRTLAKAEHLARRHVAAEHTPPRRVHTYSFHVEVKAPDRGHARGWLAAALGVAAAELGGTGDEFTMSEYTTSLVDAIEERGELEALRGLHADYSAGPRPLTDEDASDVLAELLDTLAQRITELEGGL